MTGLCLLLVLNSDIGPTWEGKMWFPSYDDYGFNEKTEMYGRVIYMYLHSRDVVTFAT